MGHMLAAIFYEIYCELCVCVMSQFLSQPLATLQPTHLSVIVVHLGRFARLAFVACLDCVCRWMQQETDFWKH